MADETHTSAIFKRHEQLKRWEESDTNRCPDNLQNKPRKVKFQDGCVFLAACSSGDRDEVKRLLERGADINTANIDGLTALHQACIDDNLDMVEFLVGNKADVDVCDNEGWTPLHATASCGFTEIARYLLGHGANVAAVNNDGDLPFDICEDDDMEKLLKDSMDEQGVDADAARREEEDRMMEDANQWLNSKMVPDDKHPKTGATALHVAAAKGYIKVISVLLQAGVNIDDKDHDGWTSLHAAAHWGQEESCKILAENMCDMEAKNLAGQTPFDVADTELIKLLEELKTKQASLKDQQKDLQQDIIQTRLPSSRRSRNDPARSSVTRMSVEQKHNVMKTDQERLPVDGKMPPTKEEERVKGSSSSTSEEETSESSDTEKKNEINKQTSDQNQPRDRDKPPVMTTVEIKAKTDTPNIEESNKTGDKENIKNLDEDKNALKKEVDMIGDGLKKIVDDRIINENTDINKETKEIEKDILKKDLKEDKENDKEEKVEEKEKDSKQQTKSVQNDENKESNKDAVKKEIIDENEDKEKDDIFIENVSPRKEREPIKRTVSAPGSVQEVPRISINSKFLRDSQKGENEIPSWRLGLRKTGSTSMVPHDSINTINEDDKNLPRSASSPRLAEESENKKNESNDKPARRPFLSSSSFSAADQNNSNTDRLGGSYRYSGSSQNSSSYHTAYVPFYKRQQAENERKERERAEKDSGNHRISAPASLPITSSSSITSPTISTASTTTTITTPTHSFVHYRKSYEPPKRDEETEMQRKVRAKRARESRRSTQGVTLEELQQANEVLRKTDSEDASTTTTTTTTNTTTTGTTSTTLGTADRSRISDRKSQDITDSKDSSNSNISDRLSSDISSVRRTQSTNESDLSSVSSWRRSRAEREEASKKDEESRASLRRSRMDRDLTQSAPSSNLYSTDSTYIPRNRLERQERNALSTDLSNTSLGTSANLTRSASLRTDRIRPTDDDTSSRIELWRDRDTDKKTVDTSNTDKTDKDKDEKRPESTAMRNRRMRRERRSTGIANYTAENNDDEDKDKENKDESTKDESKTDKSESEEKTAGRFNRYGSASDVPTHLSDKHTRPSSYSEYSRSTPALDKDYKRMYEDEKLEKERIKRELEQCKKELREAKSEIDRQMKKNESNRAADTNDKREKRALERKLSELEEEIKKMDQLKEDNRRLREENGALIRVISKLSK